MSMTVFISHKQEDEYPARYVCDELKKQGVEAYLDLLEGELLLKGKDLTNHIKSRLDECTDILVIMSDKTKDSWWVPFEIGMAAQKDFPIVSYLVNNVDLPDYLSYWPKLRQSSDLHKYISAKNEIINESYSINKSFGKTNYSETEAFYKRLKQKL